MSNCMSGGRAIYKQFPKCKVWRSGVLDNFECVVCGWKGIVNGTNRGPVTSPNYCPHCGTSMKEVK